jgi:hypothetical protein
LILEGNDFLSKKHFSLVKNEQNLKYKGKNAFITQAISQKDSTEKSTNVSLPNDENVSEARDFVNTNKK